MSSYFTDPSYGQVWAPGQENSRDNQAARDGAFREGSCQTLGKLVLHQISAEKEGSSTVVFVSVSNDDVTLFPRLFLLHS